MSRKIALPLLVAAALVSIILASRTPQLSCRRRRTRTMLPLTTDILGEWFTAE